MTIDPERSKASAIALPLPLAEPVTMEILLSNENNDFRYDILIQINAYRYK